MHGAALRHVSNLIEVTASDLVTATGGGSKLTAAGIAVLGLLGGEPLPRSTGRHRARRPPIVRTMDPIKPLVPFRIR